jgi:Domain of unknown function (DUF4387)
MRLDEIAIVIRSKNAGPCTLTLDMVFPDRDRFALVGSQAARLRVAVAARYGRSPDEVSVFVYEPALAVKISLPRDLVSGDADDRDVYGAQQHRPLLDIEL